MPKRVDTTIGIRVTTREILRSYKLKKQVQMDKVLTDDDIVLELLRSVGAVK